MDPSKPEAMEDLLRGLTLLGPTLSDLTSRVADVDKRLAGLSTLVASKADGDSVQLLRQDLQALKSSTPTLEAFSIMDEKVAKIQDLGKRLDEHSSKLDAVKGSVAQDLEKLVLLEKALLKNQEDLNQKQMDAVAKQMEAVNELLERKADKSAVPCIEDFDNKGTLLKANRIEIPTFDQIPQLVQSQFDVLEMRLKTQENGFMGNLGELKVIIDRKADKESLLSQDELREIRQDISQRLKKDDIGDITASLEGELKKKADLMAIETLRVRLDHKADLKWTQDSIRSLSDILLPVARAVRGLPAASGGTGSNGRPSTGSVSEAPPTPEK
jgi:hypothetical protein